VTRPIGPDTTANPLVSVVIPSYDRPEFVRRAVLNVLDQTYEPIECLVVDDHSPVPVASCLKDIDTGRFASFQVIRHETNHGANVARNTGIERAAGEFVAFLDDDDRWLPSKLERQVRTFLESPPEVGVVYTGALSIDADDEVVASLNPTVRGDITEALIDGVTVGSFSRVMVRRSVIERAGRPDERFPCWQDREWYFRLTQHCEFESIPEPLAVMTTSEHTQITDDFEGKRDVAFPLFLEKHRELAADRGFFAERRFVATLLRSVGWTGVRNGYRLEGATFLLRSLVQYPFSPRTYLLLAFTLAGQRTFRAVAKAKARQYSLPSDLESRLRRVTGYDSRAATDAAVGERATE
jgi:glycosyltransferase involved in cell wall biosynthesis